MAHPQRSGSVVQVPLYSLQADNSRLSGSIPPAFLDHVVSQTLGVLSVSHCFRTRNSWLKHIWQIGRNYLRGPTIAIEHAEELRSLILISNLFSCDVPRQLRNNAVLGNGYFHDPTRYRIDAQGEYLANTYPFVNPYTKITKLSLPSVVVAFTGNAAMTTAASVLGRTDAGQVLNTDAVVPSLLLLSTA